MPKQLPNILDLVCARGLPRIMIGAGDKLFLKGEAGSAMYVVASGAIEVLMLGRVLERVGPGGIVGEMALIDGNARCAAALTETDTEVIAVDRAQFLELACEEPGFALAVLGVLARRLRVITEAHAHAAPPARDATRTDTRD
ncbi:MAG: Crp/Fnr family transcriptional regulator [Hyphomicrobiaceae bacterium]